MKRDKRVGGLKKCHKIVRRTLWIAPNQHHATTGCYFIKVTMFSLDLL